MQNKSRITIAIPAYNEESNIKNLLRSILSQTESNFIIEEILVVSDGSTDTTIQKVKEIKDPRIRLLISKERIGKSQHLNNIFKEIQTRILILFDADVVLADKLVVDSLIRPILSNPRVGLVGGNPQPIAGQTFIEKAVNISFNAWKKMRDILKGGHNAYGCDGRILALNVKFYKSIQIPENMIANDAFMYFSCLTKGFEFRHVREAVVWFRSPQTIRDHVKQNKRFIAARYRLTKTFGNIVPREYKLADRYLPKLLLLEFLRHPFLSSTIYFINRYCSFRAKKEEASMTAKWKMAITTKGEIV